MKTPIKILVSIFLFSIVVISCNCDDDKQESKIELTVDNHLYEGDLYAYYLKKRIDEITDSIPYYEHLGNLENYIGLLKAERIEKNEELTNQQKITSTTLRDILKIDWDAKPKGPKPKPCIPDNPNSNTDSFQVLNLQDDLYISKSNDLASVKFEFISSDGLSQSFEINNSSLNVPQNDAIKVYDLNSFGIKGPVCFENLKITRVAINGEIKTYYTNIVSGVE